MLRIEDILSFDPKKNYPLCTGGGNLSISTAAKKAEGFAEIEEEISRQLRVCLNFQTVSCLSIRRIIANWIKACETSVFSS